MKTYEAPRLVDHGDITALTGTLGAPFTGDTSFDIDGNTIDSYLYKFKSAQRNAKEAFFRMILIVYNNTPQLFCENLK